MRIDWYRLAQVGKIINLFSVRRWVDGWVGDGRECGGVMIWRRRRCSSYAQPLEFCVLCFRGEICTGTEREGEGEGEEGVSRNDGWMEV